MLFRAFVHRWSTMTQYIQLLSESFSGEQDRRTCTFILPNSVYVTCYIDASVGHRTGRQEVVHDVGRLAPALEPLCQTDTLEADQIRPLCTCCSTHRLHTLHDCHHTRRAYAWTPIIGDAKLENLAILCRTIWNLAFNKRHLRHTSSYTRLRQLYRSLMSFVIRWQSNGSLQTEGISSWCTRCFTVYA